MIFSFNAFKELSPQSAASYRHITKVEKTGDREITFAFEGTGHRELPLSIGQLTILPEHWWTGTDADGKKRRVGETTRIATEQRPYRITIFAGPHRRLRTRQGLAAI